MYISVAFSYLIHINYLKKKRRKKHMFPLHWLQFICSRKVKIVKLTKYR